jgi:hypothetical protein
MGQVVKGPSRNPSARERLGREKAVLCELIEVYKAEQAQTKGGA